MFFVFGFDKFFFYEINYTAIFYVNVEEQCKEKKKMEKIPRRLKNKYKYQMKKNQHEKVF